MKVIANAKVNLHLDVVRLRDDGYHEIETIFQSVGLADELIVEVTDNGRIEITCDDPGIPTDERNLCHRAVVEMRRLTKGPLGARIDLAKRIPTEAGLGGGSADAAAVLLAINRATRLHAPEGALFEVASRIGSDVPFMLKGGTMLGRGRGEILTPMTPLMSGFFLIVKPNVNISTAEVYAGFNSRLTRQRPRLNLRAVSSVLARFPEVSPPFRNALEDVVCPSYPIVAKTLDELMSEQPCFASMTGSGAALFAVFRDREPAERLATKFSVRGFFSTVVKPAKRAVYFE